MGLAPGDRPILMSAFHLCEHSHFDRRSQMRAAVPLILAGSILLAGCDPLLPSFPKRLADGCYYAEGKPVFRIAGSRGVVLIPGEVQSFEVKRGGNPFRAWTTFSPAFTFEGVERAPASVASYGERDSHTFFMKSGSAMPTVQMFWGAYGDQEAELGAPCPKKER